METSEKERFLQLDMAMVQLVTTILVTLGSTLIAISIGFGLTLPSIVSELATQLAETDVTTIPNSIPSQTIADDAQIITLRLMQESINNYVLMLASAGFILVTVGISYSLAKISRIKRNMVGKGHRDTLTR